MLVIQGFVAMLSSAERIGKERAKRHGKRAYIGFRLIIASIMVLDFLG